MKHGYNTIAAALASPVDYPALLDSLLDSDSVAVVADEFFVTQYSLLAELIRIPFQRGIAHITILVTDADYRKHHDKLRETLNNAGLNEVDIQLHHADKRENLSFLTISADGDAIGINRVLVDADYVLLVQEFGRLDKDAHERFAFYPRFADANTIERNKTQNKKHQKQLVQESDNVANELSIGLFLEYKRGANNHFSYVCRHNVTRTRV
ncbi:MAG: nickel-dependent lactate racemase [Planctomycetaceae bacterium]|jgi:hypothetical protein|nr:nickel-dependent lactate racemase [Planctomycetaceae bacterium]